MELVLEYQEFESCFQPHPSTKFIYARDFILSTIGVAKMLFSTFDSFHPLNYERCELPPRRRKRRRRSPKAKATAHRNNVQLQQNLYLLSFSFLAEGIYKFLGKLSYTLVLFTFRSQHLGWKKKEEKRTKKENKYSKQRKMDETRGIFSNLSSFYCFPTANI